VLRAVVDTNTVVSALLWQGTPAALLEAVESSALALCTSAALLDELAEALAREKFAERVAASGLPINAIVHRYARLATQVLPAEISPAVPGDPDDDAVLACALAAQADLIVSGDKRVRNLKHYHGIRILNAAQALALIPQQSA